MKKFSALCLTLFTVVLVNTPSFANEQIYELQYMFVDSDVEGAGFEPNALQFKYIKPYSSYIDFEGMIALGINEAKIERKLPAVGTFTQKFKLSNIVGIFGKIHAELEPRVLLYGHLGLARIEYDISSSASGVSPDGLLSDTGAAYGIGLSFAILKKGAFVVEYNQFPDVNKQGDTIDTAALSVGYQMPF